MFRRTISGIIVGCCIQCGCSAPRQTIVFHSNADDAVVRLTPTGDGDYTLGVHQLANGDYGLAIQTLKNYVERHPEDWHGYFALGVALEATGKVQQANESYKSASIKAPTFLEPEDREEIEMCKRRASPIENRTARNE